MVSKGFRSSMSAQGITLLPAPTECPTKMTHVKRFHAPLRAACNRIKTDLNCNDVEALEMAIKCVNDTIGPEDLVTKLLLFGSLSCPARDQPAATQREIIHTMENARKEILALHARNKLALGLRYRGPFGGERADLKKLERGDRFLVYRPKTKTWMSYRFVCMEKETMTVQNERGRSIFQSRVVKPDHKNRKSRFSFDTNDDRSENISSQSPIAPSSNVEHARSDDQHECLKSFERQCLGTILRRQMFPLMQTMRQDPLSLETPNLTDWLKRKYFPVSSDHNWLQTDAFSVHSLSTPSRRGGRNLT